MPFEKGNKLGELADHTKHGISKTRLYRCWADMKTRCNCKTNRFYHRYGGRGIKVCEEWATLNHWRDERKAYVVAIMDGYPEGAVRYQSMDWCDGWNCSMSPDGTICKAYELKNVVAWFEIPEFKG